MAFLARFSFVIVVPLPLLEILTVHSELLILLFPYEAHSFFSVLSVLVRCILMLVILMCHNQRGRLCQYGPGCSVKLDFTRNGRQPLKPHTLAFVLRSSFDVTILSIYDYSPLFLTSVIFFNTLWGVGCALIGMVEGSFCLVWSNIPLVLPLLFE